MITVISKNKLYTDTLCDALKDFDAVSYNNDNEFGDALIIAMDQELTDRVLVDPVSCPVLLIGTNHEEADIELGVPCHLFELKLHLNSLIEKKKAAPVFENKRFLFEGSKRRLFDKKTKEDYYLTEKETDLIVFLVRSLPEGASKTDLLTEVWKYRSDIETHTVESHIYTLRQKIGEKAAEFLFKNNEEGYILVKD